MLADDTADPVHVAADLISQAEHDPLRRLGAGHHVRASWPTRSTPSWSGRSPQTKHTERIRTALTGPQSGTVLVADLDDGLAVVDAYAAEHLEIQTARRRARWPRRVRNAGAIFVGPYVAGVARRLLRRLQPRAAHRRLRPALGRACRCRRSCAAMHVVDYTEDALREVADARGHAGRGRGPAGARRRP